MKLEYLICVILVALFVYFVINKDSFPQLFPTSNVSNFENSSNETPSKCVASKDLI